MFYTNMCFNVVHIRSLYEYVILFLLPAVHITSPRRFFTTLSVHMGNGLKMGKGAMAGMRICLE